MIRNMGAFLVFAGLPLMASGQESTPASINGGLGKWLIDSIFEAGTVGNIPEDPGWVGTIIMPLSMIAMATALLVIIAKSVQHLLIVSQAKDPASSPISMTWAPIHMILAVTLIMPMPSGYSLGQYAGLWVGHQSNLLGNVTTERALEYVGNQGVITPPPIPQMQHFVKAAVASNMCRSIFNQAYKTVGEEYGGDSGVRIIPQKITSEQTQGKSQKEKRSVTEINFTRQGDFVNDGADRNTFCGGMNISVARYEGRDIRPQKKCSNNTGNPLCSIIKPSDKSSVFSGEIHAVHETLAEQMADSAIQDDKALAIAADLTYDTEAYLKGKSDQENSRAYVDMQKEESERIDAAVEKTIKLYRHLQEQAYRGYAQVIRKASNNEINGNDWIDHVEQGGWPLFGLYWFQVTKMNDRTLNAASMDFSGSANPVKYFSRFASASEDPIVGQRLTDRWNRYLERLRKRVENTRHDILPTTAQNYDDDGNVEGAAEAALQSASNMAEVQNLYPAMKDEMLALSQSGSMSPSGIGETINSWLDLIVKKNIQPWLFDSMRQGDIVTSMANTGHNIIAITETLYAVDLFTRAVPKVVRHEADVKEGDNVAESAVKNIWSSITAAATAGATLFADVIGDKITGLLFGTVPGQMLLTAFKDFMTVMKGLFVVGLFMAFYIPAIIIIQWLIGVVTWMIYLAEAIIVIPLWGLLFVADMGSQSLSPQSARQGFVHILSILFYPSLMVIGFTIGMKIIDVASKFFIDFLEIGINQFTEGYAFGIVSLAASLAIIGFATYQVITRVFSLVLEFNQRMMNWIGQYNNYGEQGVEGQIRQGFVAFLHQGKSDVGSRINQSMADEANKNKGQ